MKLAVATLPDWIKAVGRRCLFNSAGALEEGVVTELSASGEFVKVRWMDDGEIGAIRWHNVKELTLIEILNK